jgi:fructose 1,6-bisphosphatase
VHRTPVSPTPPFRFGESEAAVSCVECWHFLRMWLRTVVAERARDVLVDFALSSTGDDIAILMTHRLGVDSPAVRGLAWDAFVAGTRVAREQGLYGAEQDLLKEAFSGNVHDMGPAAAEFEFEERPNEPCLLFGADKTDPGHSITRSILPSRTR